MEDISKYINNLNSDSINIPFEIGNCMVIKIKNDYIVILKVFNRYIISNSHKNDFFIYKEIDIVYTYISNLLIDTLC